MYVARRPAAMLWKALLPVLALAALLAGLPKADTCPLGAGSLGAGSLSAGGSAVAPRVLAAHLTPQQILDALLSPLAVWGTRTRVAASGAETGQAPFRRRNGASPRQKGANPVSAGDGLLAVPEAQVCSSVEGRFVKHFRPMWMFR